MVRLQDTPKVKSRTRKVGQTVTAVAAVAGAMVLAAPPASAASAAVDLRYTASYYVGTASWSNRSVTIDASSFKATGCRRVYAAAWAGSTRLDFRSTSTWCNRSGPADFHLTADVVGGSDNIWVYMTDTDPDHHLVEQTCYRSSGVCFDGLL
ncbi:hypothetical protein SAMN05216251_12771 [Actinacidiphila alni]|uniref:Secreted protein n=1 Tax=Actinacidiphila alni TaxID=380248 RepID=A0A1I2L8E6_9ACTN|nr:hypothetical protein [Actinacidiphila alni]SFF75475.1 hypothetical protein SAMN05216251_12771 [Actinacidiphila alni]